MGKQLERVRSDVPGLDEVLCGGLVAGSSYIIQGMPGAGKTILANQIAFSQARQGNKVLYVTLLAESHDRLFQSLSTLDFFDASVVGTELMYMSLFPTLRDEGLSALVAALRREMTRHRCAMLVLDGLLTARDRGDTNLDVKSFVAELQGHTAFTHCTVLFLTSARIDEASPEHTMVDGVVQLQNEDLGARTVRQLKVAKSRGSAARRGMHHYTIDAQGVSVYPRIESVLAHPVNVDRPACARVLSGVQGLDDLIGGGFPAASMALVLGPSGSGKTTFALNFVSLATPSEPALYFGFYETRARLKMKAESLGINLDALEASGALHIIWNPLTENLADKLAQQLLDAVRTYGIKRLALDGLGGFERAAASADRLPAFFTALSNEIRALGVTTLSTQESYKVSGWSFESPMPELSSMMDNLLILRQQEHGRALRRLLVPVKIRDSQYDASVQEVQIGKGGISVSIATDRKRVSSAEADDSYSNDPA